MDESSCLQCDEAHGPCELHDTRRGYIARIRALEAELAKAKAKNERLYEVLLRYGEHENEDCFRVTDEGGDGSSCSCGFSIALAEKETT